MKESYIEKKCVEYSKELGYSTYKLKFLGQNGAPDRIFLKKGSLFFVEFKNDKGIVSEIQKYQQKILKDAGVSVYNIYDIEGFKKICY